MLKVGIVTFNFLDGTKLQSRADNVLFEIILYKLSSKKKSENSNFLNNHCIVIVG